MMQRMVYKKNSGLEEGEVVWMVSAYRGHDGKLKAIIMRDTKSSDGGSNSWKTNPYDEVKLTKLRPLPEDFNKVFAR